VRRLAEQSLNRPLSLDLAPGASGARIGEVGGAEAGALACEVARVAGPARGGVLEALLAQRAPRRCLVFTGTKAEAVQLAARLAGVASLRGAAALHGDLPQFQRTALMDSFKSGAMPLLVATDVAARGIHVDGLDLVVHCGVPLTGSGGARRTKAAASLVNVEQFLHRSGRTARMGAAGESLYNP
jgi:ATP-dependent RNA helicase DeaD